MANKIRDLTFQKFGKLFAVRLSRRDEFGRWLWLFRCDCGRLVERHGYKYSHTKQSHCGCSPWLKTHGLSKSHKKLYQVWGSMRSRCLRPSCKDFHNYGGRGITICQEWSEFPGFVAWAESTGYKDGLTIERKDVNAGYCPENCAWIENKMQARNRTNTRLFTARGKTQDIRAWAEESGIHYFTLRGRLINYKWDIERALTEPVRSPK